MKNYVKTGVVVSLLATAAVASGGLVLAGNLVGVAQASAAIGDPVEVVTLGEYLLPKDPAAVFTQGEEVWLDPATLLLGEKAAGKHLIGVATGAAGNGVDVVQVRLNGVSTIVAA